MNLKDIKLVISDMDGTLLNSKHEVSQEFFNLFKQLSKSRDTMISLNEQISL